MPNKAKIFISHITEEKDLALIIQDEISGAFLGMADLFVSSDGGQSIPLGTEWFARIKAALKASKAMLVLCSQESVGRPWINFEAGAAWMRDIPVMPICHSGYLRGQLPPPLNSLQSIDTSMYDYIELMLRLVACQLECKEPAVEFDRIRDRISGFERAYSKAKTIKKHVVDPSAPLLWLEATLSYSLKPSDLAEEYRKKYSIWAFNKLVNSNSSVSLNVRLHNSGSATARDVCVILTPPQDRPLTTTPDPRWSLGETPRGELRFESTGSIHPGAEWEIFAASFHDEFPNTARDKDSLIYPFFRNLDFGFILYREDAEPQRVDVAFSHEDVATESQFVTKKAHFEPFAPSGQ